jgi:DSF synthase
MNLDANALEAPVLDSGYSAGGQLDHESPGTVRNWWFDQLDLQADAEPSACWAFMRPAARPCFTIELLHDLRHMQQWIRTEYARRQQTGEAQIKYVVLGSKASGTFSLGGDLGLFIECIRAGNRDALTRYADLCIDVVHDAAVAMHLPIVTIALVQGDALGGGFEAALACNLIIAERSAKFGLPEVLFNLFPGMGAYNFLSRRLDVRRAEEIILGGRLYSADEMAALGVVDLVVEDGFGRDAVLDYLARNGRRYQAERAVFRARQLLHPVRLGDLRALSQIWVDAALGLTESDLRRMERLLKAQNRRWLGPLPTLQAAE